MSDVWEMTLPAEVAARIHFAPWLSSEKFAALSAVAAVALDPIPVGGGITSLEVLAAGTPVVTLPSALATLHASEQPAAVL